MGGTYLYREQLPGSTKSQLSTVGTLQEVPVNGIQVLKSCQTGLTSEQSSGSPVGDFVALCRRRPASIAVARTDVWPLRGRVEGDG